jgi:dihydroorotate dehydrogenase (fumarate)
MDLSTRYLGLKLSHPLVPGASPLGDDLDVVRRLEDAGAPAIVLRSLFEEQITHQQVEAYLRAHPPSASFVAPVSYFPGPARFALGPEEYLEHLRRVKDAVGVPIIASVNGTRAGGWLDYPRLMEEAGADALELNMYRLALDAQVTSQWIEDESVAVVLEIKRSARIPVAVKLSPFFTSLAHLAGRLDAAGADALVLFNRFYQPDIDVENLQIKETLHLSSSAELPLRLRWVAALSGRLRADLALTGGVHTGVDAVKAVMAGAHAVQVVSVLLRHGPPCLNALRLELEAWMESHGWQVLADMRGRMDLAHCPDPGGYERANYMMMLQPRRDQGTML